MNCIHTVDNNRDRELPDVGGWHNHAGEGLLIFKCGLGDEQVGLSIYADPPGIIICGLNCSLFIVGLFDQQIARSGIVFFLKHEVTGKTQMTQRSTDCGNLNDCFSFLRYFYSLLKQSDTILNLSINKPPYYALQWTNINQEMKNDVLSFPILVKMLYLQPHSCSRS